jgi:hypothetical protein
MTTRNISPFCSGKPPLGGVVSGATSSGTPSSGPNPFAAPRGIWHREGYGDIYVVGKKRATLYQFTRQTSFRADRIDAREFNDLFHDIVLYEDGAAFSALCTEGPAFRWHFSRLDTLPEQCDEANGLSGFDPVHVFEHVWHTFHDYYAFFAERRTDWQAQYSALRGQIHKSKSRRALFATLRKMLAVIDDGHITLESDWEDFCPEKPRGADATLAAAFRNQTEHSRYKRYESAQTARHSEMLWSYVDTGTRRQAGGDSGDVLQWGTIRGSVGYLVVESMDGIDSRDDASSFEDVAAARRIMARVMKYLQHTDAMIIDVRFNGGGDDAVSLAIANRFTDARRLAVTKVARSYLGDTPRLEAYLVPEGEQPYLKPVAVIAGPDSASATEIFVMAMRALPNTTQIGEPTNGLLSDELEKSLPGDWDFTLSNEVYFDHLGVCHEVTGVVPHTHVPVFDLRDLKTARDPAIEAALQILIP